MEPLDATQLDATREADELFARVGKVIEALVQESERAEINVLEVAREVGLEIDAGTLAELQIPEIVPIIRFVPWYIWWPWRPLWCWWWRYRYPYYHCCPYWWHRCYWYPH